MTNELMVIKSVEKRLKQKREPVIFPLQALHRKELRQLRDNNIGSLRTRLNTIRQLKLEAYQEKYYETVKKTMKGNFKKCQLLNENWEDVLTKFNDIIDKRIKYEGRINTKLLDIDYEYGLGSLEKFRNIKRRFSYTEESKVNLFLKEEFKEKYGETFDAVGKKIDDLDTKYEEAINFGDLEIVKELYYIMKSADSFFTKISELEI